MNRLKSAAKALGASRVMDIYRSYATMRGQPSWSQEGEDRLLLRYFADRTDGFYVDVGAHHPFRFSNTALLHKLGWRGINIDAMPGSMRAFRKHRPNDVNLEIGIAEMPGSARFYVFNEKALNTFNPDVAKAHSIGDWKVEREVEVPLLPLSSILEEHVRKGVSIDLMTVDAEGNDLAVLKSNDWSRWRPEVVLAESLGSDVGSLQEDPCACFLRSMGYAVFGKTVNTVMYVDSPRLAKNRA